MFFVLFFVFLPSILSVSGSENFTCDFTYGDATWNYSKVFYNQDIKFPAGAKEHTVVLPANTGFMISYVCINLDPDMDQTTTKAAYHPLEREVSVVLAKDAKQDFTYHVYAKQHGY